MARINEIYGANAEMLDVKLGSVYNYTGLNFETVITVNKSARILSKHVRPSQFFPPFETNPTSEWKLWPKGSTCHSRMTAHCIPT